MTLASQRATHPSIKGGDQQAVRFIVDRFHVGTPDSEIEADIRKRAGRSDMVAPDGYVDWLVEYALEVHHENQQLYRDVQSGRF